MPQSSSHRDLRNRLRSVQGHMRAIEKMIAADAPWIETEHQLLAVRGAMVAVQRKLWRVYLQDENCGLRSADERQRVKSCRELEHILMNRDPG